MKIRKVPERLMEELREMLAEEQANLIKDDDIIIETSWDHQENIKSTNKLLELLRKHHGDQECS